jgi:PIN domain nuclease of toxin-antitoxin system
MRARRSRTAPTTFWSPPWFPARVRSLGFQALDISETHALAIGGLPDVHRDPFDRIMIAQAQTEGLTFVARDPDNQKYPINILGA